MKRSILVFCLLFTAAVVFAKPVEVIFWHSLAGRLGQELTALVDEFNHSQNEARIKPVYKGDYIDSLTSFAAAFRAKQPPMIIQVFEVGTASMLAPAGIIKPVDEVMKDSGYTLEKNDFLPAVRAFYSQGGKLQALPFNTSVPVIFYNADLLQKAGYDAAHFPKTWDDMETLAAALRARGAACAYSSAYPSWIQVEAFSALHGLPLIDSTTHQAVYNNERVIRHLQRLKKWQSLHYFEYGGRTSDATVLFTSGRCAMFSQSSGSYSSLSALVPFRVGVAPLPIDNQASGTRHPNVAGGAALWAVQGHTPAVYHAIARFYRFLTQPEIQQRWHEHTGYIPVGMRGVYQRFADSHHPTLMVAQADLVHDGAMAPLHLGPQNLIRTINDEAMEAIFAGIKSPREAMNEAVRRANYTIMRFNRNTS
ncbi:glycerol-3-phosphate ABC transporter substrate-binding protein [Legionella taurinensis]|uniref:sn-glycerol-3-phosphate-binding periplasmic protein UgpB n=1 Tax=Legionella taurinensis TaxID=70611 RepID=A0AB38N4F3_9GAMM|nr:extracellular solute-binding protein [Legionella taurinensis]MDX1838045.1 extracellular solute-binding protein [Legionella taurinensis]PUT39370.1 glycerol-3-phosphate ABC transporter substrate-binding protein [Legionella taurinensis]PUT41679.1 glycerol-3-phosphate ABC transporter substrate-binding protein [Legionella taurinensis]PUT44513.1 glycerol-3-phosphate ABC transporter substrate-binding protein [Legionella taurinensis]PUT46757.1 glycerol-3-phosphate ABC transporter substrate-binding 